MCKRQDYKKTFLQFPFTIRKQACIMFRYEKGRKRSVKRCKRENKACLQALKILALRFKLVKQQFIGCKLPNLRSISNFRLLFH